MTTCQNLQMTSWYACHSFVVFDRILRGATWFSLSSLCLFIFSYSSLSFLSALLRFFFFFGQDLPAVIEIMNQVQLARLPRSLAFRFLPPFRFFFFFIFLCNFHLFGTQMGFATHLHCDQRRCHGLPSCQFSKEEARAGDWWASCLVPH